MEVHNDLLLAADNGDVSALCLLDLTAAFDTVDHDLMMLQRQFGLAVHGPMVWNSLPDDLRAQQDYESFRQGLKTWLFSRH